MRDTMDDIVTEIEAEIERRTEPLPEVPPSLPPRPTVYFVKEWNAQGDRKNEFRSREHAMRELEAKWPQLWHDSKTSRHLLPKFVNVPSETAMQDIITASVALPSSGTQPA